LSARGLATPGGQFASVPVAPVVIIRGGAIVVRTIIIAVALRIIAVVIIPIIAMPRIIAVVPVAGIITVVIPPVIAGVLGERRSGSYACEICGGRRGGYLRGDDR
jgi:hypothetical protein